MQPGIAHAAEEAEVYHARQIQWLAATDIDMVTGTTGSMGDAGRRGHRGTWPAIPGNLPNTAVDPGLGWMLRHGSAARHRNRAFGPGLTVLRLTVPEPVAVRKEARSGTGART